MWGPQLMPMLGSAWGRVSLLLLALAFAGPVQSGRDTFVGGHAFGAFRGDVDSGPCPHITHTQMRSLDINEEIAVGMSRDDVRDSWGDPYYVDRASDGSARWVFRWRDGSMDAVYFGNGCVQSWASRSGSNRFVE